MTASLLAFTDLTPLLDGEPFALCRAVQVGPEPRPVLLEVGSSATAFELVRNLASPSVLRPTARTTVDGVSAVVLEDFDGVSLKSLLDAPMPLEPFLRVAIAIASALAEIHAEGVIHKDIRPESILIEPESCAIKLVGFRIATQAPREPALAPPRIIEGSLPYMSPEQTGRMNRAMDQRTDLYSLGVTFYRMLTGRLPFEARDPVEWVYCHVAREPSPPSEHVAGLPRVVSDIVVKLLAKVAEDRYQTARAVAADLTRCLEQWTRASELESFPLGARDVSERIHMSGRFYGRQAELEELLAAFHRVVDSGKPELVLVSGYAGVGKSSLVRELHRPLVRERGLFVAGKADQYSHGVPYSTVATGLRDLVLGSLVGSEASVDRLRAELSEALGPNAQLVIDLIPEVELLVGKKSAPEGLPPAEAKQRFLSTCQKLVGVFARSTHPLTLFLDDLQWADPASLELLQYVLTHPDTKHLLALGAYRDTEVGPLHPVRAMIDAIARDRVRVTTLALTQLSTESVTDLLVDALHTSYDAASPLARLTHRKTEGNPFFVIQFVTTLVRDGLLAFDDVARRWRWSADRIEAHDYTDNVVALMVQKIESLPEETRAVLRLAACIGTLADVETLTVLANRSELSIHQALEPAVQEGLLLRQESSYRFLHDRIQQAAYSLVPEDERAEFQLEIGRSLLASPKEQQAHFFDIANHFLLGITSLGAGAERTRAARIFLDAGVRAKASMAYKGALTFLDAGVALLDASAWEDAHALTYALHFEQCECRWLSGDFEAAERALPLLLGQARTTIEKLALYRIRISVHMVRSEFEAAVRAGLDAVRLFGPEWSLRPGPDEVASAHAGLAELLGDRPIASLLDLPDMANEEMRAGLELVAMMIDGAYYVSPNLHPLLVFFLVSSSLRYGNCASSFLGYATYAFICGYQGRYVDADRFAQVALSALDRPGTKGQAIKICVAAGVVAWVRPYRRVLEIYERGEREAAEIGDYLWSSYSASNHAMTLFLSGEPLGEVARQMDRSIEFSRRAKYEEGGAVQQFTNRIIQQLRGLTSSGDVPTFDDGAGRTWTRFSRAMCLAAQMHGHCVFGEHDAVLRAADEVAPYLPATRGMPFASTVPFFHALALAATYDDATSAVRERHLALLSEHERAYEGWATSGPENFGGQYLLIRAEIARITGREVDAELLYERAVARARASGLNQIEGIANEVAARFHRTRGVPSIAKMYLVAAHAAFARWGAMGKVRQLEERHPELRERTASAFTSIASRPEQMDALSVVKAAQTLSGELELDPLTGRLVEVVLEQSGAEIVRLLLVRRGELRIECEARATKDDIEVRRRPDPTGLVPESITHYVWRTREKVHFGDVGELQAQSALLADEYITRCRPRSVLCLPIVRGSTAVGVLYLENNLVRHAFTPERMAALDVIASQAAITLEVAFWIRDEREARDALRASEARFRRLSDSNMFGIFFGDLSGRVTETNDYFLDLVGYTREDLASGRLLWTELTPPEYVARDAAAIREIHETGICRPFEKEYVRKDGSRVSVLLGAALMEGSKTETVTYVLDVAERKRAERERDGLLVQEQGARAAAEKAVRTRDDFLAIAAHELRTPLTPLKMQIEVLALLADQTIPQESPGRKDLLDLLQKANLQVDRLSQLMADLLDVTPRPRS